MKETQTKGKKWENERGCSSPLTSQSQKTQCNVIQMFHLCFLISVCLWNQFQSWNFSYRCMLSGDTGVSLTPTGGPCRQRVWSPDGEAAVTLTLNKSCSCHSYNRVTNLSSEPPYSRVTDGKAGLAFKSVYARTSRGWQSITQHARRLCRVTGTPNESHCHFTRAATSVIKVQKEKTNLFLKSYKYCIGQQCKWVQLMNV